MLSTDNYSFAANSLLLLTSVALGTCDNPGIPNNATHNMMHDDQLFEFGAVLYFECHSNFNLVGSSPIQCVLGRHPNETVWNSAVPVCEGRYDEKENNNTLKYVRRSFVVHGYRINHRNGQAML